MISRIRGKLIQKEEHRVILEVGGICYEIFIPPAVFRRLAGKAESEVELVIYYYLHMGKNRSVPVLIGFLDELERDFFEKFIGVSGIGPKAALKAFDKPISLIARAIEEGDLAFLVTLDGIGKQRAKHILAHLQGKVGRFALLREEEPQREQVHSEIVQEAKEILKRLQYNVKETEKMIANALGTRPDVDTVEELLNEVYRQRK